MPISRVAIYKGRTDDSISLSSDDAIVGNMSPSPTPACATGICCGDTKTSREESPAKASEEQGAIENRASALLSLLPPPRRPPFAPCAAAYDTFFRGDRIYDSIAKAHSAHIINPTQVYGVAHTHVHKRPNLCVTNS
ncbi:uncharacterized protein LOC125499760 [Athalia rosae]|uniref:uncharacterized protein LOC125499760 n=1 Tax=Athalia rosae TaxID=37344 RepID=UPI002033B423|nr:uncharacterized protein LOC125499760 [Athalia rosae]